MIRLLLLLLAACVADPTLSVVEQGVETWGLQVIAPGGGDANYAIHALNSRSDGTHNYTIQAGNEANAQGQRFAIHANANGQCPTPPCTNYGLLVGAKNATNNVALQTNHGDVVLNADGTGRLRALRNVTLGSTNDHLRTLWGHTSLMGTSPTVACGTSAAVVGVDVGGALTTGSDATTCTITFSRPFNREASCVVTARSGTPIAYQVNGGLSLALVGVELGARYDYRCDCVGGGSCQ